MKAPQSVLLVVHQHAGVGHLPSTLAQLKDILRTWNGPTQCVLAPDHSAVHGAVSRAVENAQGQVLVVAGGGCGTLRSVVNAAVACGAQLDGPNPQVWISALRMGSGNIAARWFHIPKDPAAALTHILANAAKGHQVSSKILRVTSQDDRGTPWSQHATGLLGCGILGHIPGDVKRWRTRHPRAHRAFSGVAGVESVNHAQYVSAFAARAAQTLFNQRALATVRVTQHGHSRTYPLLAGAAMTGPIQGMALPHSPQVDSPHAAFQLCPLTRGVGVLALGAAVLPSLLSNLEHHTLTLNAPVTVELLDAPSACVFVDEDPFVAHHSFAVELAGALPFVPGNVFPSEAV